MQRLIPYLLTGLIVVFLPQNLLAEDPAGPPGPPNTQPAGPNPEVLFNRLDANHDGFITQDELPPDMPEMFKQLLFLADSNGDGKITLAELTSALGKHRPGTRIIPLHNKDAEKVAAILREIYGGRPRRSIGGQPQDDESPKISIALDAGRNSLMVEAPDPLFEDVKNLVQILDSSAATIPDFNRRSAVPGERPGEGPSIGGRFGGFAGRPDGIDGPPIGRRGPRTGEEQPQNPTGSDAREGAVRIEVYRIDKADPQMALKVLQTLLAGSPGVRMDVDLKTNNLIVLAQPAQHELVRATLVKLEKDLPVAVDSKEKPPATPESPPGRPDGQRGWMGRLGFGGPGAGPGWMGGQGFGGPERGPGWMGERGFGGPGRGPDGMAGPPFARGEWGGRNWQFAGPGMGPAWMGGRGFGGPGMGPVWMGGGGFGGPGMGPAWMNGRDFGAARGGLDWIGSGIAWMAGRAVGGQGMGPAWMGGRSFRGPGMGPAGMGEHGFGGAERGPGHGPQPPFHWAAFGPLQPYPLQQYRPWGPANGPWQAYGIGPRHPWPNGPNWYRHLLAYNLSPHRPWMADGAGPNRHWQHYGFYGRPNFHWQAKFERPGRPWMAPWMEYGVGPRHPWQPHGQNWYRQLLAYNQRPERPGFNLKALFDRLDMNHDGQLSFEEFSQGVRHLLRAVLSGPGPGWARPVGWFGGQGFGPPVRPAMWNYPGSRQEAFRERITRLFQNFDKNQEGKLTKDEAPPFIQKNFDRIDTDKKGYITRRDLYRAIPLLRHRPDGQKPDKHGGEKASETPPAKEKPD